MSDCPTVSVLRFDGCCHPCFISIYMGKIVKNMEASIIS